MLDRFKRKKWNDGFDWIAESIIKICSFPIWFPVLCYKYGMVYSDNLKNKFIGND